LIEKSRLNVAEMGEDEVEQRHGTRLFERIVAVAALG